MFDLTVDWDLARQQYERNGYTRIDNILKIDYANQVAGALSGGTDWRLCYLGKEGPVCLTRQEFENYTQQQLAELNRDIMTRAQSGFCYYYYRHALQNNPNKQLLDLFDSVRGEEFLSHIRHVTGQDAITTATGQATCYRPSCFLRQHDDSNSTENRIAAYVFGFTQNWRADWGGLLHIQDETSRVVETHIPAFNTLTLFRVPTYHFVSQVANYAQGARYTTTGWFIAP